MKKEPIYWVWVVFMSAFAFLMSPILGIGLFVLCVVATRHEQKQYDETYKKHKIERANKTKVKYKELLQEIDETFDPQRYTCTKEEWKDEMVKIKLINRSYPEADELDALREADEVVWRRALDRKGYEHDEIYNVYFTMKPTGLVQLKHSYASGYEILIPSTNETLDNGGEIVVVKAEDIPREIEMFRSQMK